MVSRPTRDLAKTIILPSDGIPTSWGRQEKGAAESLRPSLSLDATLHAASSVIDKTGTMTWQANSSRKKTPLASRAG
jgi:hypothetical protein